MSQTRTPMTHADKLTWAATMLAKPCNHPECAHCARAFFAWYKTRMAQMDLKRPGETTSFADAASTSTKAP